MSRYLPLLITACLSLSACSTVSKTLDRINFLKSDEPATDIDDEAAMTFSQFGSFSGEWKCTAQQRGDSGWVQQPGVHTWRWYPILDGTAMQDEWLSDPEAPGPRTLGTNVRIWNTERDRWEIAWTSNRQQEWDLIWAEQVRGDMVMHMSRPKRAAYNAHVARITFHNITENSFDWRYESAPLTDARNYTEQSRLRCLRD